MKQLSVHQVAKQLSALLAAGEPVEITRYGKPVARLQPYPASPDETVTDSLADIRPAREYMRTVEDPNAPRSWAQRQPAQAARDALLRKPKA